MSRNLIVTIMSVLLLCGFAKKDIAAENIKAELPEAHRSFLGLTLERSTIKDVKSVFGYSEPWAREDKKHDPFTFCYKLSDSERDVWVIMRFGWAWSFGRIDSVTVTSDKNDVEGKVYETPISAKSVMTDGGLKLGISLKEAKKLIPGEPQVIGNVYKYNYETYVRYEKPRKPQGDNGFTYIGEYRYGRIDFTVEGNEIVRFHVWASGEPDW